jgi:hypothetical protein
MISPTITKSDKLREMADKSRAMCKAGTGPLFDLLVCDEAHHAVSATWVAVFKALGGIAQTLITEGGNRHELSPKQLLLTGTSHRLQGAEKKRFPVKDRHNLRIWTLTQGFQGELAEGGGRQGVLLQHTVFYEVRYCHLRRSGSELQVLLCGLSADVRQHVVILFSRRT